MIIGRYKRCTTNIEINPELKELSSKAKEELKETYKRIDDIYLYNSNKVLNAFIENQVSYSNFSDINGYGNFDSGRDKLENIFLQY